MQGIRSQLEAELKQIDGDEDFWRGVCVCLETDENRKQMLELINDANAHGVKLTSSAILLAELDLRKRSGYISF